MSSNTRQMPSTTLQSPAKGLGSLFKQRSQLAIPGIGWAATYMGAVCWLVLGLGLRRLLCFDLGSRL